MKRVVICDANILIDYAKANKKIIGLATKHLYDIWVPLPIWEEVKDLLQGDIDALGLTIFEPKLEQIVEASDRHGGGLSDEDKLCFIISRDEKAICATNDKNLRKICANNSIEVLWGLEMMIELCEAEKLGIVLAERVVRKIAQENITITDEIIKRFIERINKSSAK